MDKSMNILVIDGQGGRLGAQLITLIREALPDACVIAVGTNAVAAAAMKKAGANESASGENPTLVATRRADLIVGPIGIVIADSMLGEVTPKMACAVGQANATRILLPVNRCENIVAGIPDPSVTTLLNDALQRIRAFAAQRGI